MLYNEQLALMQVTWFFFPTVEFTSLRYGTSGPSFKNMQAKSSNKLFSANRLRK